MTTLQNVIAELTSFWQEQGCAVLPPCSFEVPLGLLHPEAFFRLLDPEPWQAAFLQPISRPADARGGHHPYRVARHLQFQVLWKDADSRAPRDLMIESLGRIGFDLVDHDLRFVDEKLTVEAGEIRGQGWRVLLDGLRLGRISFLTRLAGEPLPRRSVAISYGVELLAMARSEAADIFSVPWRGAQQDAGEKSRAKRREGEIELHSYAQEVANVAHLRQAIDGLDREALRCIEAKLPRIAYEQAMRMLPLLDLLETRGDLSLQERGHWLAEIRARVVEAARAYREGIADSSLASSRQVVDPDPGAEPDPGADPNPGAAAQGKISAEPAGPEKEGPEKEGPEKAGPEKAGLGKEELGKAEQEKVGEEPPQKTKKPPSSRKRRSRKKAQAPTTDEGGK